MYALKKDSDNVKNKKHSSDMDDDIYEWEYNDNYDYIQNEMIKPFNAYKMLKSNAMICNFLAANIEGDIEYSHHHFILRSTLGRSYQLYWWCISFSIHTQCFRMD